jgi:BMFP domain-containing protein YqiC
MFDAKVAEDMAKQFVDSLPPGLKSFKDDVQVQLKQFLQHCFSKMALVTREEFDVQTQVLAKTRAKLEELEATLAKIEQNLPK